MYTESFRLSFVSSRCLLPLFSRMLFDREILEVQTTDWLKVSSRLLIVD